MKNQPKTSRHDTALENLNKTLSFFGKVNHAIVRCRGMLELFQSICDAAVSEGVFKLCWVALADPQTADLTPVVASGQQAPRWPFSVANTKTGPLRDGIAATALRTNKVQVSHAAKSTVKKKREEQESVLIAGQRFKACAAIPFVSRKKTSGVICLFSDKDDFFNSVPLKDTLTLLAQDVSYAVDMQESAEEKHSAEKKLIQQANTLQTISDVGDALTLGGEDLASTVVHIVSMISDRTYADCSIWLISELDEGVLKLTASHRWRSSEFSRNGAGRAGEDLRFHETIVSARKKVFIPVVAVETVTEVLGPEAAAVFQEREIHSLIVVPLIARATVIGVLALTRGKENGMSFTGFENQVAQSVADRAAVNILNAGSLDKLKLELSRRADAEIALRESEARLRLFVEHAPAALAMFDLNMRYVAVSKRWLTDYNLLGREVIGKPHMELVPNISDEWKRTYRRGLTGEIIRKVDDPFRKPDGSNVWLTWEIRPWLTQDLAIGGILVFSEDTSQRVVSSLKIERQLDRLRALQTVDQTITATSDFDLITDVLLGQAVSQLKVDAAAILLKEPGQTMLRFAAGKGFRTAHIGDTKIAIGQSFAGRAARERVTVVVPRFELGVVDPGFRELAVAEDFASVFVVPLTVKDEIKGVLEVFFRSQYNPDNEWIEFLETFGRQTAVAVENARLFDRMRQANEVIKKGYDATIEGWSFAMDLRDRDAQGHSKRVAELTVRMAEAAGMSELERVHVRRGAMLHDMGKLGIPDSILHKPGPLTSEERATIEKHPQYAYDMLVSIEYLRPALEIPYCHHEKWDGTGYPRGLSGTQIPKSARLFSIAEVWDSLTHDAPYRKAWPNRDVVRFIRERAGTDFDPDAVDLFLRVIAGGVSAGDDDPAVSAADLSR